MRRATPADRDFFLALRNDPEARRWSPDPREITPEAHAEWYASTSDALFLEDGVATVRVAIDDSVSLVVAPQWRGHGYGGVILRQAMEAVGRPHYAARIHRDHAASLITFLRCGFSPRAIEAPWVKCEWLRCPHCAAGTPLHWVGRRAISDECRYPTWDLHEVSDHSGVGLAECLAR